MRKVISILSIALGVVTSQAQTPGPATQTAPTPLYVFNNNITGNVLQFEPRTHRHKDDYEPICYTTGYVLAAGTSISFFDPTQMGVPFTSIGIGNVNAIYQSYWPNSNILLNTVPLLQEYGAAQKWHEIKFQLGISPVSLGGNLRYPYTPETPVTLINTQWEIDANGEIWHVDPAYQSSIDNGSGNSATWNYFTGFGDVILVM